MSCPSCHHDIRDIHARYCPYCSKPLSSQHTPTSSTRFPVVSGLLAIIASGLTMGLASQAFVEFGTSFTWHLHVYGTLPYQWLLRMTLGFSAFGFGMIGGILAAERRHFVFAITGSILLIASGLFTTLDYSSMPFGLFLGPPLLTLGLLSSFFLAASRKEFT